MNWLICSAGRRVDLVKHFKEELNKQNKKIYTTDRDKYAPALYFSDDHFILDDRSFNNTFEYINKLIRICRELDITSIISIHDVQIMEFAKYKQHFQLCGINLIISDYNLVEICYDKLRYNKLPINQVPTTVVKARYGSASNGLVRQPYIDGTEYNIQCYFNIHTSKLIDVFMQEKLAMRAGETDKSISIWDDEIFQEIIKLDELGFKGVIDIDVIKADIVYIIDINTRFGGGYTLTHYCGCNYVKYLVENEYCIRDNYNLGKYQLGISMMKYNGLLFKESV